MARAESLGRQPFAAKLRATGRSLNATARILGFDGNYVFRVSKGITAPSPELRRALSDLLGEDESALFTPEALATEYRVRSNACGLGTEAS